jgi:type IV secretory pathway TrbD component
MALRKATLHRAGIRPHLFLGGDREMVLFSGLIAAVLVFGCLQFQTIVAGVVLWSVSLFIFRRIAKADPLARAVFMRHRLYRRYYPARSRPYRINKVTRFSQSSAFSK